MCASHIFSSLCLHTISRTHVQNGCSTIIRLSFIKPDLFFPGLFSILAVTSIYSSLEHEEYPNPGTGYFSLQIVYRAGY